MDQSHQIIVLFHPSLWNVADVHEQDISPRMRLSGLLTKELRDEKDSYEAVILKTKSLLETVVQPLPHTSAQNQESHSVPFLQDVSTKV